MHRLIVILFALVTLTCKDSGVSSADQDFGQMIFETEFTNWAWGYDYQGTVVYQDGSVFSYNPGKDSMAVLHHFGEHYAASELRAKYEHRKMFIRTVSPDTISMIHFLASRVTSGNFSDTTNVGADGGSLQYSIYLFHPASATFERVVLRVDGDWTFYNKSNAAVALAGLMSKL